jgi:hypothetical protein
VQDHVIAIRKFKKPSQSGQFARQNAATAS